MQVGINYFSTWHMQVPTGTVRTNLSCTSNTCRKMSLQYRLRESPLRSRGECMTVDSLSNMSIESLLTKTAWNNTVRSLMQCRMTHPISWGGGRHMLSRRQSCHSCFTPLPHPPPRVLFISIFAWICSSYLSAHYGDESSTWGGWACALLVVESPAPFRCARENLRELAGWLVMLLTSSFPSFPNQVC